MLARAVHDFEDAHVSTIHGFCAELLRERPVEARIDPAFTVLTQSQADAVFDEAFAAWLPIDLGPSNNPRPVSILVSPLASYHNGACGFAFADSHSEIRKWVVPRTRVPVRFVDWTQTGFDASEDPRDIRWIQERTTERP